MPPFLALVGLGEPAAEHAPVTVERFAFFDHYFFADCAVELYNFAQCVPVSCWQSSEVELALGSWWGWPFRRLYKRSSPQF